VILFAYHLAWTFFVIILLPFIPLLRNHRLVQRLTAVVPKPKQGSKTIWIHALSVGEVLSALPLVKSLRRHFPEEEVAFTVTTRQGMEIAQRELKNDGLLLLPMPLDFWRPMLRMIRCIRPKLFILIETDLWPGLMDHLSRRGVKIMLVNGRVSPRTLNSYKRFRYFFEKMLGMFHACLMQTELDRRRLLETGIKARNVKSLGNIKFDRGSSPMDEKERREWLEAFNLTDDHEIWLAGSTHRGEERIILDIYKQIRSSFPRMRLIIAPRRTERAEEIRRLAQSKGLTTATRTALTPQSASYDVLILDTMGELGRVYGIAGISFVGGSLVPEGGHNLLEPASFGCPVLFGPHMDDFKIMAEQILETGGGILVHEPQQLLQTVSDLVSQPEKRNAIGVRARQFVESNQGALARVTAEISEVLQS
jgi:3-deoxy-D-manno-octulosonic-acid transferase